MWKPFLFINVVYDHACTVWCHSHVKNPDALTRLMMRKSRRKASLTVCPCIPLTLDSRDLSQSYKPFKETHRDVSFSSSAIEQTITTQWPLFCTNNNNIISLMFYITSSPPFKWIMFDHWSARGADVEGGAEQARVYGKCVSDWFTDPEPI